MAASVIKLRAVLGAPRAPLLAMRARLRAHRARVRDDPPLRIKSYVSQRSALAG